MNLVRTDPSGKFICCCWRNLWCDYHVTHTPKCNESAKIGQIINCRLTILIVSLFSLSRLRIMTQLRSGAVDKMAGIFTKRIWQPCICQPNDLKLRKKLGEPKGGHGPPRPPLESPLVPLVPTHEDVWDNRVGPMVHEQSMIVSGNQTFSWCVSWFPF